MAAETSEIAAVSFVIPGSETVVQEHEGQPNAKLRRAIEAARRAFWLAYRGE
jgi:hypothetical protein